MGSHILPHFSNARIARGETPSGKHSIRNSFGIIPMAPMGPKGAEGALPQGARRAPWPPSLGPWGPFIGVPGPPLGPAPVC